MFYIKLEGLICLENITDTQSTYLINNIKLSRLFNDILKEGRNGKIPILETRILLHSFTRVTFVNEREAKQILMDLTNCFENKWYSLQNVWNHKTIIKELKTLQRFIFNDYLLSGSIIIFDDDYIKWDLFVSRML